MEEVFCNVGWLFKEGAVELVKLEGGELIVEIINWMVVFGIFVMGYLGLML